MSLAPAARAQDPFADEAPPTRKPAEGVKGEEHQALARPKVAEAEEPPPVGPVERLPPTAYPEWRTRGLYGGSLWLTFHGMPWPYYPKTGIGISGSAWIDTGFEQVDRAVTPGMEATQLRYLLQQGRGVLRVTPTYSSGPWFAQTQLELVANKNQTEWQQQGVVDVDDLWVRAGKWRSWDVTLGRFEAFEVYHFGMGLDLNTLERRGAFDDQFGLPDPHTFAYGALRPPNLGNAAVHLYLWDVIRVELLAQVGNEGGLNAIGGRPAIVFDVGWLKLKAAGQVREAWAIETAALSAEKTHGFVGAAQIVLDPYLEFGANFDYGYRDFYGPNVTTIMLPNGMTVMDNYVRGASYTSYSYGGFANARVITDTLLGVGVNYNTRHNVLPDATTGEFGEFNHLQAFAAVQYIAFKRLFIKLVAGYARAHLAPSNSAVGAPIMPWDNSMVSARVRFMYLF